MCGILGFSKSTTTTDVMFPTLAIAMAQRGTDSWGVTDGETIHKDLGCIVETYHENFLDAPTYHTRAASVGAVTRDNAHPFKVECAATGLTVVGVHNGHLSNWSEVKRKYNRSGDVDSYQIFAQIAEQKPLSEIAGWGTVVWYEYPTGHPEQKQRYISRFNSEALAVAKLDTKASEIVFASTKTSIERAAILAGVGIKYFYETKPLKKYRLTPDALLECEGSLDWATAPLSTPVYSGYQPGSRNYTTFSSKGGRPKEVCRFPSCSNRTTKDELICGKCLDKIVDEYLSTMVVEDTEDTDAIVVIQAGPAHPMLALPASPSRDVHEQLIAMGEC